MPCNRLAALLLAVFTILSVTPPAANAAGATEDFSFRVTPYYWSARLAGNIGYAGFSGDLGAGSETGSALLVSAEAMYAGRMGILADLVTAAPKSATSFSLGRASVLMNATSLDLWAFYRLCQTGDSGSVSAAFDLMAGGRLWSTNLDLAASVMGFGLSVSKDKLWIDPMAGARIVVSLGPRLEAVIRGGIGGFGLGSDLTWDAQATLSVKLCDYARIVAGYRAMGLNDSTGNAFGGTLNAILHGPILGLAVTF